jgi:hypothetical protein
MTTYFIEPGDWEAATGECLPSGISGIVVVPVADVQEERLALTKRVEKLESALRTIIEHQKMIGGGIAQWSTTRMMAENALKQDLT